MAEAVGVVDVNALIGRRMLALWRSLPPHHRRRLLRFSPPPPSPEVASGGEQDDDEAGGVALRRREWQHAAEEEQEAARVQLTPFLDALPHEATELVHYYLTGTRRAAAGGAGGGGAVHVEAVCLSEWAFASSGPHACLSFLDRVADADAKADNSHGDDDGDDEDKRALFNWLGRALVSVNRKQAWAGLSAAGGGVIVDRLIERLRQALRALATGGRHDGGGGSRVEDTERTALVLIECLRLFCISTRSSRSDHLAAAGLLEEAVQASENVAVGFIKRLLPELLQAQWSSLAERLIAVAADMRVGLVVRDAALGCFLTRLRYHAYDDDFRDHIKALLSLAGPCEPAAIRCKILQELPLVHTRRRDAYDDDFEYNDHNALLTGYIDVALAAATCDDVKIAMAATSGIAYWALSHELPSGIDALTSHWHVLLDNVVRPGDGVHSLLHMAAKQVAQFSDDQEAWRGSLPVELGAVIETFLLKKRRTWIACGGVKKQAAWTLRTATINALAMICGRNAMNDRLHSLELLVQSKMGDERWQNREAGLLVLECLLRSNRNVRLSPEVCSLALKLLTDPLAKVRTAASRVIESIIPSLEPDMLERAAEQLVLVMLHDAKASTRQAAFMTLGCKREAVPWYAAVLTECMRHRQSLLHGLRSSAGDSCHSRWIMLLQVVSNGLTDFMPHNDNHRDVMKLSTHVLLQSLDALWHHEEARMTHAESATQVLKAISKTVASHYKRHGSKIINVIEMAAKLERHADSLLQWEKGSREAEDGSGAEVTTTAVCNQLELVLSTLTDLVSCEEPLSCVSSTQAAKWASYAFELGDLDRTTAQRATVVLNLLLAVIKQHHEGVTTAIVASLPVIVAHIRTLSSYEPARYEDALNAARLVRLCVETLARHWPNELGSWVGDLSSIVLDSNLVRQSGAAESLRCLAWLAQCGDGDVAHSAIDSRAIHVFAHRPHAYLSLGEAELPTRGLVNLLDALLVTRGLRRLGSPFSPAGATKDVALPLLILLVRRLPANDLDHHHHQQEEEETSKLTRVLLALGELIDPRKLANHEQEWRPRELALRRVLPTRSGLLASLLFTMRPRSPVLWATGNMS